MLDLDTVIRIITALGAVATAIGVFVAYRALKANHDWNRRQYAVKLVEDWNPQTLVHRKAVEALLPGLIDVDKQSRKIAEITKQLALEIYASKSGEPYWELKFHLIELLNYFEPVSASYQNLVADEAMVRDSFKQPLENWYQALQNFITVVAENRRLNPWKPYTDVIARWKGEEGKGPRPPTG